VTQSLVRIKKSPKVRRVGGQRNDRQTKPEGSDNIKPKGGKNFIIRNDPEKPFKTNTQHGGGKATPLVNNLKAEIKQSKSRRKKHSRLLEKKGII